MKDKIVLLFLLICALQSRATSYYINDASQAGDIYTTAVGNNANPGTAARPFATLAHALGVAVAGDSIFIDAGSYSDNNLSVT